MPSNGRQKHKGKKRPRSWHRRSFIKAWEIERVLRRDRKRRARKAA